MKMECEKISYLVIIRSRNEEFLTHLGKNDFQEWKISKVLEGTTRVNRGAAEVEYSSLFKIINMKCSGHIRYPLPHNLYRVFESEIEKWVTHYGLKWSSKSTFFQPKCPHIEYFLSLKISKNVDLFKMAHFALVAFKILIHSRGGIKWGFSNGFGVQKPAWILTVLKWKYTFRS